MGLNYCKRRCKKTVRVKAFDDSDTELGRCQVEVELKADDAKFYDFNFDKRTPLLSADYFTIDLK